MTIRIVMGPGFSGKTHFIREHFPNSEILSVGEYQRRLAREWGVPDFQPLHKEIAFLQKVNDIICENMVQAIREGRDTILEHTLAKAKRRKEYMDAFRAVTDAPVDIYVMQPSGEDLLRNLRAAGRDEKYLDGVKFELRQIEMPTREEGFAHIYLVSGDDIADISDRLSAPKFIDKNTKIDLQEQKIGPEERIKPTVEPVFGDAPFLHICEVCGKTEILTSKEAFDQGWDYPGDAGSVYPAAMFGVLSPRTCGSCGITRTAWWAIAAEHKSPAELSETQLQTIERIKGEPENLRVSSTMEDRKP